MAVGIFNSTYYGKDYRAGAALLRARRPYLFKNAATGLGLFVFSIGVSGAALPRPRLVIQRLWRDRRQAHSARRSKTIALTIIFSMSTDAYTIRAVGQEEFSDVKVPDAPAQNQPQK
ncbi:hypothetical protein N7512_004235 [Penicillium capsulatum]|nr:hypothetical protein N7512_004235 [Penicillium capsulatum]